MDCLPAHVGARRLHRVVDRRLEVGRQRVVLRLVEQDLELLGRLVEALQHAVLDHVREAEDLVRRRVVELGRVDQAAVQRRHDLAAGQRVDREPHLGEHVDRQAHRAELQALEVLGARHRLLVPAERLRRHRTVEVRHHVHVQALVDLVEQRLAAAVVVPGEELVGVHAERRARTPKSYGRVLAVPVGDHAMAAVERALVDRVEQLERRHDCTGRKDLDLQAVARHVVDLLGKVICVLVKDVLRRPGRLEAEADGLCTRHHRHTERGSTCRGGRGAREELAAIRLRRRSPARFRCA